MNDTVNPSRLVPSTPSLRRRLALSALLVAASGRALGGETVEAPSDRPVFDYPEAPRSEQVDVYHGTEVADPYRWLEDEESEATRSWVTAQDRLLAGYLAESPRLAALVERISDIRAFDAPSIPVRRSGVLFSTVTPSGRQRPKLVVRRSAAGEARELIDFETAVAGEGYFVGGFAPSPDAGHVVWSEQAPTTWGWLEVARVDDGRRIDGKIEGIGGMSAVWTRDSRGFFYVRYGSWKALQAGAEPRPELYYHRLGTPPSEDRLHFSEPGKPNLIFTPKLSDDGRYLVLGLMEGTRTANRVVYADLAASPPSGRLAWKSLIDEADAAYVFEGNAGRNLFFSTTLEAPRSRVVAIDLERPERESWVELVPERDAAMAAVSHVGGRLVVQSTRHALPVVEVFKSDGTFERRLDLPSIGLISGFNDDPEATQTYYRLNGLYDPGTVYRVDLATGESAVHRRPGLAYDPERFTVRQVFYDSEDGVRVPMFIAHRRDLELDGERPLLMYGYGHGGWMAAPWFQPHLVAWLDLGGVYALPGIRGGGEYGYDWQQAGTRRRKQTTIDDFVAAAEWLIREGYTSAAKLVANGGSASGVLAAAAVVQRPELFGAALVEFPFIDMLRYHRFTRIKGWTSGYGSADDPGDFAVLRSYSPLHNLEEGRCYPAVLTVVAGEDTSTKPMHGYKFTAALQAAQGCGRPVMLKTIPGVGHYSYGAGGAASARNQAEIVAFLLEALGRPADDALSARPRSASTTAPPRLRRRPSEARRGASGSRRDASR